MDLALTHELVSRCPCLSAGAKNVQARVPHRWNRHDSIWSRNARAKQAPVASNKTSIPGGKGSEPRNSSASTLPCRDAQTASPSGIAYFALRAPQPAHNLTTSPELLLRRQEQRAAAQELTRRLVACGDVTEAKALYNTYEEHFNAIHFAALFTSLARLATAPPSPPARHYAVYEGTAPAAAATAAGILSRRAERAECHGFVRERLLPHLGLRLMGLGPRQLAAVLAALARLDCPPPGFWMSEWLQHFARRVELPPPAAADTRHAGRSGNAAAAAGALMDEFATACSPTDIARAMWALARLRMRRPLASPLVAVLSATTGAPPSSPPRATSPPPSVASAVGAASALGTGGVDGPSLGWLQTLAQAFAAQAATASAADLSSYLWAAARLGYRPPEVVMAALMARCEQLMGRSGGGRRWNSAAGTVSGGAVDGGVGQGGGAAPGGGVELGPRELCVVLWALAVLGFSPGLAWLRRAGAELAHMAGAAGPETPTAAAAATVRSAGAAPMMRVAAAAAGPAACTVPPEAQQEQASAPPPLGEQVAYMQATRLEVAAGEGCEAPVAPSELPMDDTDWWSGHLHSLPGVIVPTVTRASAPASSAVATCGGGAAAAAAAAGRGGALNARQAATCAWAFARLGHRPSKRVLAALLRCACPPAPSQPPPKAAATAAQPQDLSMASFALGVLRFRPEPGQATELLRGMAARLRDASSQDLVVWAAALARMRLAVPDPWFAAYLRRAARELETLPPLALVNWVDAVARLRTARPPRRSRMELALLRQAAATALQEQQQLAVRRSGAGTGVPARTEVAAAGPASDDAAVVAAAHAVPAAAAHGSAAADPWVVVALPPAKPPRSATGAPWARRRRRHNPSHRVAPAHQHAGHSSLPLPQAAPPATSDTSASPLPLSRQSPPPKPGAVFIRPAARHLQRSRLLPRLLRLAASRLPQLDLEQHCRLAWAAAHLHTTVHRSWVAALVTHTGQALERRLRLQQQPHGTGRAAAAAPPAGDAGALAAAAAAAQVPVVDARWVLKLARAVEMLLRGPRRGPRLELAQRRRRTRRDPAFVLPPPPEATAAVAATSAAASEPHAPNKQVAPPRAPLAPSPYPLSYIPRRWRSLMMMAVLPQLSALTNAQLLRFVRTMARLRGGAAGSPSTTAAGAGAGARDMSRAQSAGGGGGGDGSGGRGLAAELGGYCRRRVEATCGGEDACDLTTAELLRWTRGWEERQVNGGNRETSHGGGEGEGMAGGGARVRAKGAGRRGRQVRDRDRRRVGRRLRTGVSGP